MLTALLLAALAASPAASAPSQDDRLIAGARADFDRDVRRAYGLLEDLEAAVTDYAGAGALSPAADAHARRYKELGILHWTTTRHIRSIQKVLDIRQVRAAANALNTRRVSAPVVDRLSGQLEDIAGLEETQKLLENAISRARAADLEALRAEEERRGERRRQARLRALVLGGSLAAAACLLLLPLRRRKPPPPPPAPPPPDRRHRPKGPARLE
ncbi:MAG: hypothetical protein HY928_01335 [Elusimicrobia bacterium]|nr:hypothetical protein [Elusimicrobiota bacterium]